MNDFRAAVGYVASVALSAWALHGAFTSFLTLRADPGSSIEAGLCALAAAALSWPRRPLHELPLRQRHAATIGSRTAGVFYLLFTALTVIERAPEYMEYVDGVAETVLYVVFSLPLLILFSTGAMIYGTAAAGFFVSIALATLWMRVARRLHPASGCPLRGHPLSGSPVPPAPRPVPVSRWQGRRGLRSRPGGG
ncbi:hypothetical protein [Azospirillum sp.]|uniref:hypothetical protein n=1 Tax=Azospirillum sp. TaxID=34012 RepID=UPI002D60E7D2|nr:hypothetical protein [Azospirillum sp.]HYD65172.1 hypothetical protein [Azospirillum sp.]